MPSEPVNIFAQAQEFSQRTSSFFIGPKAENAEFMSECFNDIILAGISKGRNAYFKDDQDFIPQDVQASTPFNQSMDKLRRILKKLSDYMSQHNIPFYSPRYMAHMAAEPSLPSLLGYMLTLFYNPNNVAAEASPLTTQIEYLVGQDLCEMLGYRRRPKAGTVAARELEDLPVAWGHITCGGSIANLESMWAARNLKFWTLALKNAMTLGEDPPLAFVYETFKIKTCAGEEKLFKDCTTWELLNLKSATILSLADDLAKEYGISSSFVESVLNKYIIQTVGKEAIEKQYEIKPAHYFISNTNHYSWPKSAAVLGIGSENLIHVPVDLSARLDIDRLDRLLSECLQKQRPVYGVAAIIGSTEMGAVDPLSKIVTLRKKYESMGLTFLIHADAAWGGYFASILRPDKENPLAGILPARALSEHTRNELSNLKHADSITLDPHKSGYCPYPGGGLCYRDERMRLLLGWTSPYLDGNASGAETMMMGVYGIEGSKPGAAPVGAFLSHSVIGLHSRGYGALLAQAIFTGARLWCHWATMKNQRWFTVPFSMLPSEREGASDQDIEKEKDFIRRRIINIPNERLFQDEEALEKLRTVGSDLMINAYSVNFHINGTINTNIVEANYFNKRLFEELSVTKVADQVETREVIIMATLLSQKDYGECLTNYKRRLGLVGDDDLYVLCNVSQSPYGSLSGGFVSVMATAFEKKAEQIYPELEWRNKSGLDFHSFVIQGTDQLYFSYIPNFHTSRSRKQLIFTADLPENVMEVYKGLKEAKPLDDFLLYTSFPEDLEEILKRGTFKADLSPDVPVDLGMYMDPKREHVANKFQVTNVRVVKNRSLDPDKLTGEYPNKMAFYIYGSTDEAHIAHILFRAPNVQLKSDEIKLNLQYDHTSPELNTELKKGAIAVFETVYERAMHPFTIGHPPTFFTPNTTFKVQIYKDATSPDPEAPYEATLEKNCGLLLAIGTITLGVSVFTDFKYINMNHVVRLPAGISEEDQAEFGKFLDDPTKAPAYDEYHQIVADRQDWMSDMLKKGVLI